MIKDIYGLLNYVETDLDDYEKSEPNEMDIKRWKKNFKSGINKNTGKGRTGKRVAVAGIMAAVVLTGLAAGPFSYVTKAAVKAISYDIASFLGIKKDLEPYKTVVGQSVKIDGLELTLNEVILDEDVILISTTKKYDEKTSIENDRLLTEFVYVNGHMIIDGASGGVTQVDDYTMVGVTECNVSDVNLQEQMDFEIQFVDWENEKNVWKFEFSASGEELVGNTNTVELNQSFMLEDGTEVNLYKLTDNAVGQRIYFTTSTGKCDYDIMLKGVDNCGNPVEFDLSMWNTDYGRLNISTINNGNLSDEATELYLTPYAVKLPEESGKMSNDYKQAGEEFCIKIR